MIRNSRLLLLLGSIVLFSLPAAAADNGFYIGGSVGQSQIETGNLNPINVEGDDMGWKAFAGGRFITFVGVEGAYADLGSVTDEPTGTTVDMKAYTVAAVGYIPLGIADIFGKAGAANWHAEFPNQSNTGTIEASDTDPMYGAGFQFRLQSFTLRGEVEYFDIKNANNVYMYSAGLAWTF